MSEKDLGKRIKRLEKQMLEHARNLEFEKAARVRDQLALLREQAFGAPGTAQRRAWPTNRIRGLYGGIAVCRQQCLAKSAGAVRCDSADSVGYLHGETPSG